MATDAPPRQKPRHTFMLHDPADMTCRGKYVSTDHRYAALKVASKGHDRILLRKTNTKEVREFRGEVVELDTPKQIMRGDRPITYSKKPRVRFVRKFVYDGELPEGEREDGPPGETVA